jgi:hypothetical protein
MRTCCLVSVDRDRPVSRFYKRFNDPIEVVRLPTANEPQDPRAYNGPAANTYGLELELRHDLALAPVPGWPPRRTPFAESTVGRTSHRGVSKPVGNGAGHPPGRGVHESPAADGESVTIPAERQPAYTTPSGIAIAALQPGRRALTQVGVRVRRHLRGDRHTLT